MLKKIINGALGLLGKEIRSVYAPLQNFERGLVELVKVVDVDVIVDVGVAQGTPELYKIFVDKKFLLIEANPLFRKNVEEVSKKLNAKFEMVFCGAVHSTVPLLVPKNGRSASIYKNEEREVEQVIQVPVETLDSLVERNALTGSFLLKIDVEDAEMEVLSGAAETLKKTKAVIMEISFGRGSEGASTAEEKIAYMKERGFSIYNIIEGGGIREHGRLVHADFVFIRR